MLFSRKIKYLFNKIMCKDQINNISDKVTSIEGCIQSLIKLIDEKIPAHNHAQKNFNKLQINNELIGSEFPEQIKNILINKSRYTWKDLKHYLTKKSQVIFTNMDDHAEMSWFLFSMSNYIPIIRRLINCFKPQGICEIGVESFFASKPIEALCKIHNARHIMVDPTSDPIIAKKLFPRSILHNVPSSVFLKSDPLLNIDMFFIDGEHTYESLYNDLCAIAHKKSKDPVIIFLHDMSYPHSYRDVIYQYDNYPYKERSHARCYLFPTESSFATAGIDMTYGENISFEGGNKNELLKAVEDFLIHNRTWDFTKINSLFGLGILCNSCIENGVNKEFINIKYMFDTLNPFFDLLEFNRILLITRCEILEKKTTA